MIGTAGAGGGPLRSESARLPQRCEPQGGGPPAATVSIGQFGRGERKQGRRCSPSPSSPRFRVTAFPRSAPSRLGRRGGSRLLALRIAARRAVRAAVLMHELCAAVGADADELQPRRMVTITGGFAVRGARDADLRDWCRPASDACVGGEL